jgi:heat shock protein HtpX
MMSKFYNNMKTAVLMGAMTGLILLIGHLLGGTNGVMVALIVAAITNFVGYFFSDKIALMTMRAQEVGPEHELYQIVEQLARRAGLPMPRVYVSPQPAPNAFATGRSPRHAAVCATEGLLQMLNRDEIAGVMAHELAHVKHRDILIQSWPRRSAGRSARSGYMFMFGGGGRTATAKASTAGGCWLAARSAGGGAHSGRHQPLARIQRDKEGAELSAIRCRWPARWRRFTPRRSASRWT